MFQDAAYQEVSCDQVKPFRLDDDFDYDNVVLSCKYTPEEMDFLSRLRQGSAGDTQVSWTVLTSSDTSQCEHCLVKLVVMVFGLNKAARCVKCIL